MNPSGSESPRGQVCGICHDHGWYREVRTRNVLPCTAPDCGPGRSVIAVQAIRKGLGTKYTVREVEDWLQARNGAFGGERPIYLLREGREAEVLATIEAPPGLPPR